jgi:shikimate dehydrogenase
MINQTVCTNQINAHTQLFGVIGNPVRHSLSSAVHNHAFQRMGLNAVSLAWEVKHLADAVDGVRGLGIRGMSVTLPFNTEILPMLDGLGDVAAKIRAVNTISNREGKLIGHNTDWMGAVGALQEKINLMGKQVLLLGAGGTARAIAFGLKKHGCRLRILNRSTQRGIALARELGIDPLLPDSFEEINPDIVVNATPVGMHPRCEDTPLGKEHLKKGMVVMDAVYCPLKTRLLREAEEKGCLTIDGLEMLAHQCAAQLELWTERRPDAGEIKEDLVRALDQLSQLRAGWI